MVGLWDVETGKHKSTLKGHTESVISVAFSQDGKTVASGGWDKTIRLWDVETGKHKMNVMDVELQEYIHSIGFSPDGQTVASGSANGTI